jgi:hypothetical protein
MRELCWGSAGAAALLFVAGGAMAAPAVPAAIAGAGPAEPAAMCGYSCRSGGRYIPGPPSVCYEEGLRYCGSSREYGDAPRYRERRRYRDNYEYERPRGMQFYFGR